ncbi:MAG: AMP-binding protein [Deltaproteobacteria bacterium]|nr:AMP-binding protein [Deltaproteobacteria bacterium]
MSAVDDELPRAFVRGLHSPLGAALARALDGSVRCVDGPVRASVIVELRPLLSDSRRADHALLHDVESARDSARQAKSADVPLVLASRLSAIGSRKGLIAEEEPARSLFGGSELRGAELDVAGEIRALESAARYAKDEAGFADRRSRIAGEVKAHLRALGGAASGRALSRAVERALDDEAQAGLERALVERAAGWRFSTASTFALRGYTSALAELVAIGSGARVVCARLPDLLDVPGGALAHVDERVRAGAVRLPLAGRLEALPLTTVAEALAVGVRGALAGASAPVIHLASSDKAPLLAPRLLDLYDLHLRRMRQTDDDDAPRATALLAVDRHAPRPPLVEEGLRAAGRALSLLGAFAPKAKLPAPVVALAGEATAALSALSVTNAADLATARVAPFFDDEVRFSQRQLRACALRAGVQGFVPPAERLDWRTTLLERALPTLDEARRARAAAERSAPLPAWDSLGHLLVEAAERFGSSAALSRFDGEEIVDVSYRELLARARAVALRLQQAGVQPGDRVILAGANHPAWGICAFGALLAGATLVPLDPALDDDAVRNVVRKARPFLCLVDKGQRDKWGAALPEPVLDLQLTSTEGPGLAEDAPLPASDDVASILFTSGTTGEPKGVMLTHGNFCALLASLQSIFPTGASDRMLSVLPLHHTFEFSCGLLMPLASGARIFTPEALTGEKVLFSLKAGKITALVGVPALWQLLERRIAKQAAERGETIKSVLDALLAANRAFGKATGLSFGKLLLKPIHDQLGGHLRVLISGGSALPPGVHDMFQGLGLPLAEGYGLTESAPVLTIAEGKMGAPAGTVGKPIPGVELRIVEPDPTTGIGEVWAKAPNVMKGYFEDEAQTRSVLEDGWLKTGDLGKIDDTGRLRLVGRSKDVVVTASGENVYLDDVEKKLEPLILDGDPAPLVELTLLGLPDPKGGERLALAYVATAVPGEGADAGRAAAHSAAQKAVQAQVQKLPAFARPSIIERVDGPLPRTSTRKVKRKDVRRLLEELLAKKAEELAPVSETPLSAVRAAVALVAGVDVKKLSGATRLPQDLGFDSLMWVELGAALEPLCGKLDPELLVAKESIAELENLVREAAQRAAGAPLANAGAEEPLGERPTLPRAARVLERELVELALPLFKPSGRRAISFAQREMFRSVFHATVSGRAFIPHNRASIVVANHTSHLDTGLVKFALGSYGEELRPLAAKDYFFEGNKAKVAFFEHFTNLVPIDRETGSGLAFEQARAVLERGHTALIFPEGTRREDGTIGAFKPLVARLSLATGVDVLPIWMKGNYQALPRGTLVPNLKARELEAHIGPPLPAVELRRLVAHLPPVQQARTATDLIKRAIVALAEGRMLDLSRVRSLEQLERGVVEQPRDQARA